MARYRKKPIVVEAMQWDGTQESAERINNGAAHMIMVPSGDDWTKTALWVAANQTHVAITPHEWVIKDSAGFYPCQPDIFQETYEEVD
jgi:hypothetical protein